MTFTDAEREHRKWLSLDHDPDLVRLVFATVIANRYDGAPVWVALTGPSGSGKTAVVVGIAGAAECASRSSFTPAAFASGTTGVSMLDELSGKVMIVRDFSTIAEMQSDRRNEVGSILRDVYDGKFSRSTGRQATPIEWQGKIGMIACSTPKATDDYIVGDQSLGQRFLVVRISTPEGARDRIIDAAYDEADQSAEMTEALEKASSDFLDAFQQPEISLPSSIGVTAKQCADAVARARSGVVRDRFTRDVDYSVADTMESPFRIVKQMKMLAAGLYALDTPEDDTIRMLRRIAADSIPTNRLRALQAISAGYTSQTTVATLMGVSHQTAGRILQDLTLLGVVGKKPNKGYLEITLPGVRDLFNGVKK